MKIVVDIGYKYLYYSIHRNKLGETIMKVYIYHKQTKQVACVIVGDNNKDIEREIKYQNYDNDVFNTTDNPEGLSIMYDTEFVDVCGSYE